jgi:hypothetical protein
MLETYNQIQQITTTKKKVINKLKCHRLLVAKVAQKKFCWTGANSGPGLDQLKNYDLFSIAHKPKEAPAQGSHQHI